MKPFCYLVPCRSEKQKRGLVRALLDLSNVLRVTDHGPHIKVISTKRIARLRGARFILVPDRTKHWDVRYWDFAMTIARHAQRRRQRPRDAFGVIVHYLCNLWGLAEIETLAAIIAGRAHVEHTVTDEQAHGWELRHLRVAERLARTKKSANAR